MSGFSINSKLIGIGHPPYIVAEMSGNHNGDIDRAFTLIKAAKQAGVDAIKFQTYTADTLTIDHDGPEFRVQGGLWDGRSLYELYQEASTPWEWHERLFAKCHELGLTFFSTPFDESAVDFLEDLNVPAYKVASFEVADPPLIKKIAATGKPMIISTGMASEQEIAETVTIVRRSGCSKLALLHCVSAYPAPVEEMDLQTIPDLAERFGVVAGLSDHTLGIAAAVAGVALGASLVEKHFTLRRADGGPDAAFSVEPGELKQLCEQCRIAWSARGRVSYHRKSSEQANLVFRRSLYVVKDIAAGEAFTVDNLRSIRPGYGLAPKHLPEVLGKTAAKAIRRGTAFNWSFIANKCRTT